MPPLLTSAPASAWTSRSFRYLLGSETTSLTGSAVSTVALAALAVLELRATTAEVALLAFVGQLPNACALWAGAFSDRYDKRRQLLGSDFAAAGALVSVPVAAVAGVLTIGQLYAVLFLVGSARVVHDAAAISLLPAVVPPPQLQNANSALGAASSVADSAGSNVGAALVGGVGPAMAVLADVASFVCSAVLLWRVGPAQPPVRPGPDRRSLLHDIAAGVRYVIGQATIRTVIAALATLSFGMAIMNTYWALYLLTALDVSPTAFGVIMGTAGSRPLAAATAGALALVLDVPAVLAVGALLQVLPTLLLLASPVLALRAMPIPPTPAAVPPAREGAS